MKSNRPSILIIEDDANLVLVLTKFIRSVGFDSYATYSGKEGLKRSLSNTHDLFLIDLGLKDIEGFDLIERIRKVNSKPIIVITGSTQEENEVESFKLKVNIFHRKPVKFNLLEVQMRSLIYPKRSGDMIKAKNIQLDISKRVFKLNNQVVPLTKTEFNFLLMLLSSNGEVFSRRQIICNVMNYLSTSSDSCVDTMVSRVRKKLLDKEYERSIITTVNGSGYKLNTQYLRDIKRGFS